MNGLCKHFSLTFFPFVFGSNLPVGCNPGETLGSRAIRVNWASQRNDEKAAPTNSLTYEAILAQSPTYNTTVYVGNISPDTTRLSPLFLLSPLSLWLLFQAAFRCFNLLFLLTGRTTAVFHFRELRLHP